MKLRIEHWGKPVTTDFNLNLTSWTLRGNKMTLEYLDVPLTVRETFNPNRGTQLVSLIPGKRVLHKTKFPKELREGDTVTIVELAIDLL